MSFSKPLLSLGLIAFLLSVSVAPATAQGNAPRFEPTPCSFKIPSGETIQCGYVSMPENRAAPNGAIIRLAVAIVKSHAQQPAPDPVVFLHGGPAVPILFQLPELLTFFQPILASRDMIFFDQRGVGKSQPTLHCPEFIDAVLTAAQKGLLPSEHQAQLVDIVTTCRASLTQAGIDLTQYTSANSAADIAELRTALGYSEWNIYAGSYGTRVAFEVLRSYPTGIRSAILDSPVPPQANLLDNLPGDIQQAFENLFQICAEDWGCRLAYPNLKEVFYTEVQRLNAQPAVVTIPTDGNSTTTYLLSGNDLIDTFYNGLLSRQLTPLLPAILYDAQDGNYEKLAQLRALNQKLGEQFALGTYLSTTCSEETPFNSLTLQTPIHPLLQDYLIKYRTFNGFFIQTLCRAWPTLPPSPTASLAVASDLPTLILAGKLDPLTPPALAHLAASTLSRSRVYEFPGLSHGVLTSACPMAMAAEFLNNPTQAPNANCISQLDSTPNFFIRAAATRLPTQLLIGLFSLSLLAILIRQLFAHQLPAINLQSSVFAFRFTGRLLPLLALAALVFFFIVGDLEGTPFLQRLRLVATILPLFAGLQAASLFSPEDEPALEVTLACPRPLAWTLLERLATLFGVQGVLAFVASLLINVMLGEPLGIALIRWLPPMLCLVAVALTLTLNSRQSIFSVGAIVLLWFGFAWGGDPLVQVWPFLWPLHLYLQPEHPFFWLNRALLILLGLNLLAFALIYLIRDEERILLGDGESQGTKIVSSTQNLTFPYFIVQNLSAVQFLALLRYEFLINWRRRVLPVFFLAGMTLPLLVIFLTIIHFGDVSQFVIPSATLTPEAARQANTASLLLLTWAPLFMVLLMLLPPAVAETVPRDQQLGVRELLNSLPLTSETYLSGKLLSLWLSLFAGIVGVVSVVGVVWWFAISPFDVPIYLQMLVLGAFPVAALNSGVSLLLAANQPNRRRAIVIGIVFCIFSLVTIALSIRPHSNSLLQLFSTSHTPLFTYFLWGWMDVASSVVKIATWTDVLWDLGIGLAQLVVAGLIAWGWMRWRDASQ